MDLISYLSKNLKFLRKSRQWSQEELARRLGIKRSNIAAYESKNVEPRLSLLLSMAKLFNVDNMSRQNIPFIDAIKKVFSKNLVFFF